MPRHSIYRIFPIIAEDPKRKIMSFLQWETITTRGRAFIAMWILFLLIIAGVFGVLIHSSISNIKGEQQANYPPNHYAKSGNDSFRNICINDGRISQNVTVGIYVDHIKDFSILDSKWTADFFIWFVWKGNNLSRYPPDTTYRVVNEDLTKNYKEQVQNYSTTSDCHETKNVSDVLHYRSYHQVARITKVFDTRLYPLDKYKLNITVEDDRFPITNRQYIPDRKNSTISNRAKLIGMNISGINCTVTSENSSSNQGMIYCGERCSTYSQFNYIISIERYNWSLIYFRLFDGLIVAVIVSMLPLFIRPDRVSPRFGLGVGSLFAAIANNYIVAFSIPVAGEINLPGMVHGIGVTVILLTLIESIISLHIYDIHENKSLSKCLDTISVISLTIIFFLLNWGMIIWSG